MTATIHKLKIKPEYLKALLLGDMTCNVRFNDRDYQVGDILEFDAKALVEFCLPSDESQPIIRFEVTHILSLADVPGLEDYLDDECYYLRGLLRCWVVLSLVGVGSEQVEIAATSIAYEYGWKNGVEAMANDLTTLDDFSCKDIKGGER
jgi:hypothetical protein